MKKIICFLSALLISSISFAQESWIPNSGTNNQRLFERSAHPTVQPNMVQLYAVDTGGVTTAFILDSANNFIRLTQGGALATDALNGMATFTIGEAVTAGSYQMGRDADGTNQLHSNVPTGATFEWSINDVPVSVWGANSFTFSDSTNADGIRFVLATGDQSIRSVDTDNTSLRLQDQTFTPGATHNAVAISPTWTSENQVHTSLQIGGTQNGANSSVVQGLEVSMVKATGATTLANLASIIVASPTIAGTVTNNFGFYLNDMGHGTNVTNAYGIYIVEQTASATLTRAISLQGSGAEDGIELGATGVLISNDGDGAITFKGQSTGADEDVTLNLDDTSNVGVWSSSTGLNSFTLSGIGLTSTVDNFGWTIVDGTDNTACTSQCTTAAVHGWDGTTPVSPDSALADICLCAGAN